MSFNIWNRLPGLLSIPYTLIYVNTSAVNLCMGDHQNCLHTQSLNKTPIGGMDLCTHIVGTRSTVHGLEEQTSKLSKMQMPYV